MKPTIENPNSSGQGYHPDHLTHPLTPTVTANGYAYSHSVPVGYMIRGEQLWSLYHCFKRADHNVSLRTPDGAPSYSWETSTSCASGRRHNGIGAASLAKHLKSKSRRYPELTLENN